MMFHQDGPFLELIFSFVFTNRCYELRVYLWVYLYLEVHLGADVDLKYLFIDG